VTKFNGMVVRFKAYGEEGKRIESIAVKGLPLQNEKIYSICACERDGDPTDMICRIKNVLEPQNMDYTLHENMRAYLKENSPVTPTTIHSAIALDAPETLLTQVHGVDYQFL